MTQRTLFKLSAYGLGIALGAVLLGIWLVWMQGYQHDRVRFYDLRQIRAVFDHQRVLTNSYRLPGCTTGVRVALCPQLESINDPRSRGAYEYVLEVMSDQDYAVRFSFERGFGPYRSGTYLLTPTGIVR